MITEINSEQNSFYRALRRLDNSKEIRRQKQFLIGGARLISEIKQNPQKAGLLGWVYNKENFETKKEPTWVMPQNLYNKINFFNTPAPLALLKLPTLPQWGGQLKQGITLFLPFQNPLNIGAALRSASAFGVQSVVLLDEAAFPFLPKSARAAGSALFHLPLFYGPSLKQLLQDYGSHLVLLDAGGDGFAKVKSNRTLGLVAGLEGSGFPDGVESLLKVGIAMPGNQESLNAAVAVSVALYELSRNPL